MLYSISQINEYHIQYFERTRVPANAQTLIYIASMHCFAGPTRMHRRIPGLTGPYLLDLKLTYSTHIHNISVQAHKPLQMIKALIATGWDKQKETPIRQS